MTTRTQNDVRNFNEAINKCRMPVFLVSSDGTRYNMKSADQNVAQHKGAACSQTESPILINTYSPRGRRTGHIASVQRLLNL